MTPTESRKPLLSSLLDPELRAWRGRTPLPVVFWGYGVSASLALAALHGAALVLEQLAFQQALILATAAYTVWIVVAIWRSAANASPHWGGLARWLTVAWTLNSAFVLLFLQIELALRYAGG